jgi:hypothetical protein
MLPPETPPFNKLPIIESNALFPNDLNKQTFRSWKYATIIASISTDKDPEELSADTGCSSTIAGALPGPEWCKHPRPQCPSAHTWSWNRTIHAKHYALMDLFIPGNVKRQAKAHLKMRVLVIPCLPAKLLIGSNTLATDIAILNYSDQTFTISTGNLTAPMKVKGRDHGSVQRVIRKKNTVVNVIPAASVQPVHITMRDQHRLPKDHDYCFWPDRNEHLAPGGGTYNHIVDADVYFCPCPE